MGKNKKNKNVYYQCGKMSTVQKPTRDKSKDKIYAIILCVFIVFWTIASVLGSIGFFRTNAENVYEDEYYSVEFAPLNGLVMYEYPAMEPSISSQLFVMKGSLFMRVAVTGAVAFGTTYNHQHQTLVTFDNSYNGEVKNLGVSFVYTDEVDDDDNNIYNIGIAMEDNPDNNGYFPASGSIPISYDIYPTADNNTLNIVVNVRTPDNRRGSYSFILYVPNQGYEFFYIPSLGLSPDDISWNDIPSYPIEFFTLDENKETYQQGYQQGIADGGTSYFDGYNEGQQVGYNDGFGAGYNQGVTEAGDYTFTSLIGAVIDVPVHTFLSLFNFELLGIDLAGFFLSLLTVCVIIAVVKLFV